MADPLSLIIKAIKVKIALNRLSRLKENAVREHMGLPPKTKWTEECYEGFMSSLRTACCEIFTPCCILGKIKRPEVPDSCIKRIFFNGTYENDVFKNVLGFICGVLVTIILYLIMVFQIKFTPLTSSLICTFLGALLTLGLAFTSQTRLMVLLIIPQFFTSKGRSFLLMYAVILVMNHPVQNFNKNVLVMSDSSTCGQEMAFNQTREVIEAAFSPMAGVIKTINKLMDALKQFAALIRKAFTALQSAITEIAAVLDRALKWLGNIVNICNEKMGQPFKRCNKAFETAFRRCKDALGIFGFICHVVKAVSYVCYICKITDLLCIIASWIKNLVVDKIVKPVESAIFDIKMMFYFNVTINYHYEFNMTQSKSYTQVRKDIMNEVKERLGSFSEVMSVMTNVMLLTIIFVFIKAVIYRQKYLSSDKFDNYYLTYKVQEVDQRRKQMGKERIYPMTRKEKRKYVASTSIKLVRRERCKMAKGFFILFIAGCHASFYLMSDYGLWWLLTMLRKHLMLKTNNTVPPHLKMHVQGRGAMADMYKAMIGMFDPIAQAGSKLETAPCLPEPYEPEWAVYDEIGCIFGLCVFLVMFEAYGLRLRHIICGCFFPKREGARGVWLYNHMLKTRGGFLKFERRKIRREYNTSCSRQKASIKGKLAAKYEICRKLLKYLGWEQKACLSCGREGRIADMENFYHCVNGDCRAVYCCDCYDDLNNMCTVCMNPIDYGDLSDYSEERDSSEDEDEYLKKKEEARLRREERDRIRAENSPSKLLIRTGFMPIPQPKKNDDTDEASSQIDEDLSEVFSDEMAQSLLEGSVHRLH
ncbi:DC-STAMP domain-containing protein 2-like [Mytilus californianus]|uniref:DC-STAMP domain-containing protein 2-like n=1 Tax=Mytilus californianus TaxID=6549 RepID=UPI0022483EB3|nr:DC-STAMP domain-containing protein 2-like [Mytilus californianus]